MTDRQAPAMERLEQGGTALGAGHLDIDPGEKEAYVKDLNARSYQQTKDLEKQCKLPGLDIDGGSKDASPPNPGPKQDLPETITHSPPGTGGGGGGERRREVPPGHGDHGKGDGKNKPAPPLDRDDCDESWRLRVRPTVPREN
jgi:hypothetical protein